VTAVGLDKVGHSAGRGEIDRVGTCGGGRWVGMSNRHGRGRG
jgi:hypothetical protein